MDDEYEAECDQEEDDHDEHDYEEHDYEEHDHEEHDHEERRVDGADGGALLEHMTETDLKIRFRSTVCAQGPRAELEAIHVRLGIRLRSNYVAAYPQPAPSADALTLCIYEDRVHQSAYQDQQFSLQVEFLNDRLTRRRFLRLTGEVGKRNRST